MISTIIAVLEIEQNKDFVMLICGSTEHLEKKNYHLGLIGIFLPMYFSLKIFLGKKDMIQEDRTLLFSQNVRQCYLLLK